MGKAENLKSMIEKFVRDANLIGAMIVTRSGLVVTSEMPSTANVNLVAAMAATVFGTGQRVTEEINMGKLKMNIIEGEKGRIIVIPINEDTLLCCLLERKANLGLFYIEVGKIIKNLKDLL